MNSSTTIAAIATASASSAGISIVRISGPEAFAIADRVYHLNGKKLSDQSSHTIHYGYVAAQDGQIIDEALFLLMRGPKSYTGEDTVEIDCHGGIFVTRKILNTVLAAGAVPAAPGEFTKRAFLNGKMDLSRAEAVIEVINSANESALKNSVNHLRGAIYTGISEIRDSILDDAAFIEAGMDDPEHIDLEGFSDTVRNHADETMKKLQRLLANASGGKLLQEGIVTAILGKPNAGKSSLLNLLCQAERAIVTQIPGTTRDVLEETVCLPGGNIQLRLLDTAGIRDTDNPVEKIGVEKSKEAIERADLILFVLDSSIPIDENDRTIYDMIKDRRLIVILSKSDLDPVTGPEAVKGLFGMNGNVPFVSVSSVTGEGIDELETVIKDMFYGGEIALDSEVFLSNSRQTYELSKAYESMKLVREAVDSGIPEDLYVIDLMNAYTSLGNIIGESLEEDVIDRVFAKFCMGK